MAGSSSDPGWIVYGSDLSPFTLKVRALCAFAGLAHRYFPEEGGTLENLRADWRIRRLKAGRLPLTWPEMSELDEFPLVPFLLGPDGENLYDSSAIAEWLDRLAPVAGSHPPLGQTGDPAVDFVIRLLDEYADEYGLYMAHHFRWKVAARDNDAGRRLAHELRSLAGPARPLVARYFSARQVRRLPYLFSLAPAGYRLEGLPSRLQPPSKPGFLPTHALLEDSYRRLLRALEGILQQRPYLLGERFCLADASVYGQLAINLDDPSAARFIEQIAPTVFAWVARIRRGDFSASAEDGRLRLDDALAPLLEEVCRTYVPLMRQNEAAWRERVAAGETLFNEAAFNRGRSLYDGEIDGNPFRAVVKTFQVKTWREVCRHWEALDEAARDEVERLLPAGVVFSQGDSD